MLSEPLHDTFIIAHPHWTNIQDPVCRIRHTIQGCSPNLSAKLEDPEPLKLKNIKDIETYGKMWKQYGKIWTNMENMKSFGNGMEMRWRSWAATRCLGQRLRLCHGAACGRTPAWRHERIQLDQHFLSYLQWSYIHVNMCTIYIYVCVYYFVLYLIIFVPSCNIYLVYLRNIYESMNSLRFLMIHRLSWPAWSKSQEAKQHCQKHAISLRCATFLGGSVGKN